jgi:PAS domain S-box-containing protein
MHNAFGLLGASTVEARERLFRAVFSDAADAMLVLDARRVVVEANRAAGTLFGRPPDVLIDQPLDSLFDEKGEEINTIWHELMALGEAKREHRVTVGRGTRLVECSYRAGVQPDRHLCVARDITDRRMLEERLLQSEKIESIGRLAGGIAHDFNNLLTAILGYTELLLSHSKDGDPGRSDLEEIERAGQRAAGLTQKLLAFSRKQVLMPKELDLNETLASLKSMLRRVIREDVALTCAFASGPAIVKIDPTQIEQVILNLVLNARDALPGGGEIHLELARVDQSDSGVPEEAPTNVPEYVRLRVTDNGVGIPPEVRAHLFEPFFTTKELGKGTGLGLASVYGIVRQSNGFITVESEPGVGTTFTMHFPAASAPRQIDSAAVPVEMPSLGRETILLVEDEDSVRVIVGAVLRRQGYQVLEASTARGACEVFEQHESQIQLLLTDVVMPEMNGPALAQRLIAHKPELRVLFISGYSDMQIPLETENPNLGFLSKPFQASALTTRVREMLVRPRGVRFSTEPKQAAHDCAPAAHAAQGAHAARTDARVIP